MAHDGTRGMITGYDESSWLGRKHRQGDKDEPLMLGGGDELGDPPQPP
jgi:hypothetical protein